MNKDPNLDADYEAAGFGGRLPFGAKPVLLVIDVVEAYLDPKSPLYAGVEAARDSNIRLVHAARKAGVPVVFTNVTYAAGGVDGGVFYKKVPALKCFLDHGPYGAFPAGLEPRADELVISKQYPSAFFATPLAPMLRAMGVDTVVMGGFSTSGCVRASALDALQNGFIPYVVREACGDRAVGPHEANLFDIQAKMGEVVSEAEAVTLMNGGKPAETKARVSKASRAKKVVIAGGGIGGLTTAIVLARAGHEVEVLEQAPNIGPSAGAGVTMAPNAMLVYRRLGLEDAMLKLGVEPTRQRIQHWQDGRNLIEYERGPKVREQYNAPYLYIHRADLHHVLMDGLMQTGRATVRLDATVTKGRVKGEIAAAKLQKGEWVEGDLLIGADGVKSPIRALFEQAAPDYTGHIAWRALAPIDSPVLRELADFPGVHIGPGRMVVRYPVSQGSILNLVFFARQEGWAEEGWTTPAKRAELQSVYKGWAPEVTAMINSIDESKLFKWGIFARKPLKSWVKDGRITLLGDAAHAMTPFMGQGASSAIEDAVVLGRCLDLEAAVPDALDRYQRARQDRCAFIQKESNENADRMQGEESELYGLTEVRNEESLGLFNYDAFEVEI